jgi:hypothetical protein
MGIRASLTEITPDAFEQILQGGEPDVSQGSRHFIDKAWHDFHVVFSRLDWPLNLVIAGDGLHPQSPHSLQEFCAEGHDFFAGFMSPALVREIAGALHDLSLQELTRWYDELGVGGYDREFYLFNELKAAYVEAAKRKRPDDNDRLGIFGNCPPSNCKLVKNDDRCANFATIRGITMTTAGLQKPMLFTKFSLFSAIPAKRHLIARHGTTVALILGMTLRVPKPQVGSQPEEWVQRWNSIQSKPCVC